MTNGDRYGAYRLSGELDSGGMATVHVATHMRLGHMVAIKVLHRHYQKDEFLRSRFVDEARIQANLVHENVLTVRDILELQGTTAIVMDLLRGLTLKQYFRHAGLPLPTRRVLDLFIAITDGLDVAHRSGIVHRDLKPSNIFLHAEGERVVPKIMDFGVAKHQWMDLKEQDTATGTVLGTPHYMAPEQYDDASTVDRQADVFSLGVMLFEATTGRIPFEGRRPAAMMASVLTQPVPKPSGIVQVDYPLQLEEVILRCLEKDPLARYRNAAALRDALQEVVESEGREEVTSDGFPVPELEEVGIRLDRLNEAAVDAASGSGDSEENSARARARGPRGDDSREQVGSLLSGYRIQDVVQDRWTIVIYRGVGVEDGRPVLLKGSRNEITDIDELARMRHEFQLLRDLDIEGAPRALDLVAQESGFVLVLEDEGGVPLSQLLEDGPLDLRDALAYAFRLAGVVTRLHARDVIHKQITPDNVFINPGTGVVELVDFGLASTQPAQEVRAGAAAGMDEDLRYASPEQTGRVNRALDYRTDFYSLGATLYHALTGAPPFTAENPEELVRMVVSRRPDHAWAENADVPAVLSDIVDRLLAKDPEVRYQSGRGLQADLERCLRQLLTAGGVQPFQLGAEDVSERLSIPQKLYGRDLEVKALLNSFERTRTGPVELLLVAGLAGIGKTALVGELGSHVNAAQGIFVEGKFDQYTRDVPYGAIIDAFHSVVRDVLTRSDAEREDWRRRILEALGSNAAVFGEVAPGLYDLIGPQPVPQELPPAEARNRFLLAVHNLIGVFARPDHPMVFFLDDLQWSDAASLRLLVHMVTARDRRHLLVIGAYRDNEVDATHPFRAMLDELENTGRTPAQISLEPLAVSAVTQLTAEALDRTIQEAEPLGETLHKVSGGNPFFLGVCLRTFQRERWIQFQMRTGRWTWELDEIRSRGGDLSDLLERKIVRLSDDARHALRIAACIGNQFDLLTLALVLEQRPGEVLSMLKEAVAERLVIGLGETYKYFDLEKQGPIKEVSEALLYGSVGFKFGHDRIQQAAYRLTPGDEREAVHWTIGRLILRSLTEAERITRIFTVVNQLNAGRALATDADARRELTGYNLLAARRAKASTAYRTAYDLLELALELCDEDDWEGEHRDLVLDLHVDAAEAAYLSTEFEAMERYVDLVIEHAASLDEKIRAYEVKIQGDIARARKRDAIRTGLQVLALLGVKIPAEPTTLDVGRALIANRIARGRRSIEALADAPEMTDPRMLAVMRVAAHLNSTAYVVNPNLFGLLVLKQAEFSARYGNTVTSAYAYALQGTIMGGILGRWPTGYRFGRMALELLRQTGQRAYEPETIFTAAGTSQHFREHLSETFEPLLDAYRKALENGNFEFVGVNAGVYVYYRFYSGAPLREVVADAANYAEVLGHVRQDAYYRYTRLYQQAMLNLLGEAEHPLRLRGRIFDEDEQLACFVESEDGHGIANLMLLRMLLHYLLGEPADALDAAREARDHVLTFAGMIQLPEYHFYHALAVLACEGSERPPEPAERRLLRDDRKKLARWARYSPENMEHKWLLVRAEQHRVAGRESQAVVDYDRAIELAGERGYVQEQALANELSARFYLAAGRARQARTCFGDAWEGYRRWGAAAKLRRIEMEFPELAAGLPHALSKADTTGGSRSTTISRVIVDPEAETQVDVSGLVERLQDLRKELHWDRLLARILSLAVEQSGAARGALVLRQKEHLVVEAETPAPENGTIAGRRSLLGDREDIARAVIAWVVEQRSPVVLGDAPREGSFTRDSYVYTRRPRSILCAPLLLDGETLGALYLEEAKEPEVFDVHHLRTMEILAEEATVALDNAMKYKALADEKRDLEQQLKAFTEDQRTIIGTDADEEE